MVEEEAGGGERERAHREEVWVFCFHPNGTSSLRGHGITQRLLAPLLVLLPRVEWLPRH